MTPSVPYPERKVMDSVFEGLFLKALGADLTPKLKQRIVALGVELDGKLKPRYPHTVWVDALVATCEELMPGVPLHQALHALGARTVQGYFETFMGKALKQVLRALGVKRTLGRMSLNFSSTNNYTQSELKELGPRHFELWMNELSLSQHNMTGIIETGLTVAGGKNVRVKLLRADDKGCTYDVQWD